MAWTQLRTLWKWEEIDVDKINPEYTKLIRVVDKEKIDALVKAKEKEAQAILGEGVRVFDQSTTAHRRG
jgi:hypothetical protein